MCPEKARKSASQARTSVFMWGTHCAPSTKAKAPLSWATLTSSATGESEPSAFDMALKAKRRVLGVMVRRATSAEMRPSASTGTWRSRTPLSRAKSCQGTRFEWCSSSVTRTSSPGRICLRAQPWATRLMASVVLRVKTMHSGFSALMKRAALARDSSTSFSPSSARVCTPRWMLALWRS
ncbi:MAG: hypothetical protein FD126_247 [Elusimicrobia bacterium]|nr:MAG: hypothetical protein FD126_247 [Elusimicrobiota bacterium]